MHTSDFNFLQLLEISVIYGEHFCTKIRVKNKNDKKSITLVSDYVIFSILIRMEKLPSTIKQITKEKLYYNKRLMEMFFSQA